MKGFYEYSCLFSSAQHGTKYILFLYVFVFILFASISENMSYNFCIIVVDNMFIDFFFVHLQQQQQQQQHNSSTFFSRAQKLEML